MSRTTEKLLYLDSRFCKVNDLGDFNFDLSENVTNCLSIQLTQVSIPWSFSNINKWNNKLDFNDGEDRSVEIHIGNYDIASLLPAIKTALLTTYRPDLRGLVYTVTFSQITNKISIKVQNTILILQATSTCKDVIGLSDDMTIEDGATGILEWPVNLLDIDHLQIRLPKMIKNIEGRSNIPDNLSDDIMEIITLSGFQPWDLINLSYPSSVAMKVLKPNFNSIVINITDPTQYTPETFYEIVKYPFLLVFKLVIAI